MFQPRMQAQTHALHAVQPLLFRRFAGAIVDLWQVRGEAGGGGSYIAPDPRIVVFLDPQRPEMEFATRPGAFGTNRMRAFYIPPGVPLWSRLVRDQEMAHIDFHLEGSALRQRLEARGVYADLNQPRMILESDGLRQLGGMVAAELRRPRCGEMLLDGLLLASLGEIFGAAADPMPMVALAPPASGRGLTALQFSRVERHLQENLGRHLPVAELAEASGLSESWFAHCFRDHTGETPLRWQARLRLQAAEAMLAEQRLSLADIACACGFADQAHFSRQFRTTYGLPPSAWRRVRFAQADANHNSPVQDPG